MEEKQETKYYTRSNGEKVDINTLETTHLINALTKKYRDIFESKTKDDYSQRLNEINDLKENLYGRFNKFHDNLGE